MKIEQPSPIRQRIESLTQGLTPRIASPRQHKQEQATGGLAVRTHLKAGLLTALLLQQQAAAGAAPGGGVVP